MLDFSRFEVLTFDCYGTLIDWETGLLSTLQRVLSAHAKQVDNATLLQLYGDFEQRAEEPPYLPYREVLASVVRRLGEHFGFVPSSSELLSLIDSLPSWKPWPDTLAALELLKNRYRLAILSNIDDDLFARTRPQLGVKFDEVITAQQAQAYKPSRKIFELALSRINAPSNRVLHVGQSIYHDVIPARNMGLATVWVNRPSARPGVGAVKAAQAKPEFSVTSLEELVIAVSRA
ncbi:MAG TPA: haloacid dehalogenase type II [Dongiaceae bacterium]|nr:haloacid dehalogenase type II [Dongiaceae bacterium]